jgi:hypothetical protein
VVLLEGAIDKDVWRSGEPLNGPFS